MNHSGDAAEQVIRLSLEGVEVAAKITGSAAKNIAALILAALKSPDEGDKLKLRGKERLTTMLKSGQPLEIFSVKEQDLKAFVAGAKQYGIVYCVLKAKGANKDGICDILVKADDAPKINRLVERLKLADVEQTRTEREREGASERDTGTGRSADGGGVENETEIGDIEVVGSEELNDIDWLLDELLGKEGAESETGDKPPVEPPKPKLTEGEQAFVDWENAKAEAEAADQNLETAKSELTDIENAIPSAEEWANNTNDAKVNAENTLAEAEEALKSAEELERQKLDKVVETSVTATDLRRKADKSGLEADADKAFEAETADENALSEFGEAQTRANAARNAFDQAQGTADMTALQAETALNNLLDVRDRFSTAQDKCFRAQERIDRAAKAVEETNVKAFEMNKIDYALASGATVYVDEGKYTVQTADAERVLLQDANEPLKTWSLYREDLIKKLFDDRNNDDLIVKPEPLKELPIEAAKETDESAKGAESEGTSPFPLSEKTEDAPEETPLPPSEPLSTKETEPAVTTPTKDIFSRRPQSVKGEIADITERREKEAAEQETPTDGAKDSDRKDKRGKDAGRNSRRDKDARRTPPTDKRGTPAEPQKATRKTHKPSKPKPGKER